MSEYLSVSEWDTSEPHHRYLPVMINRLMLSTKKACAASDDSPWSLGEPTTCISVKIAEHQSDGDSRDEIHLHTFTGTYEEARESQA